jgi:phospholipid/cholesterol/gamma-HCH transport system substrate-binding protein
LKISKEIKTGVIALLAIGLLVTGVNFLKGNSFFGGDEVYYAYFSNSGGIAPASSVVLNGVGVGKVLAVENILDEEPEKQVRIKFNLQNHDLKIPKGSVVEIGPLDLFTKGLVLTLNSDISQGYYEPGDSFMGVVAVDIFTQVKAYADPVTTRLQGMMEKLDNLVVSFSSFWDTTATSSLQGSMKDLKITIQRFGNVAKEVEDLIVEEKVKLGHIFSNVESITQNLKISNDKITGILGNAEQLTDDLVKSDFKTVINDAQLIIQKLNLTLEGINNGEGTLGKLVKDDVLFTELVQTNKSLQLLIEDLTIHPERYVHLSLIGRKVKGVPINSDQEKKLRNLLDSIPD